MGTWKGRSCYPGFSELLLKAGERVKERILLWEGWEGNRQCIFLDGGEEEELLAIHLSCLSCSTIFKNAHMTVKKETKHSLKAWIPGSENFCQDYLKSKKLWG